ALTQQSENFSIRSASLAGILIKNGAIKSSPQDFSLLADVFVPSVSGAADHDDTLVCRHGFDRMHQSFDGIWIVSIVGNQRSAAVVEQVESAGRSRCVIDEASQGLFDDIPR